jgi:hypothetical protein
MRRPVLVALLVAASVGAMWSFTVWAQVIDSTPCQASCYEQKAACVSACGTGNDPVECEAECDDQLADCLEQCR